MEEFKFDYKPLNCLKCDDMYLYSSKKLLKINNSQINRFLKLCSLCFQTNDVKFCVCCEKNFCYKLEKNNLYDKSIIQICPPCTGINGYNYCSNCEESFTYKLADNDGKYCYTCKEKYMKCRDCDVLIKKEKEKTFIVRCKECYYKYKNNSKKEYDSSDETNSIITDDCEYITKNCEECKNDFVLSNNELTWKKICNGCYLEKNEKINCEKCNRLFNRKINEKWKKNCYDCYKK